MVMVVVMDMPIREPGSVSATKLQEHFVNQ